MSDGEVQATAAESGFAWGGIRCSLCCACPSPCNAAVSKR